MPGYKKNWSVIVSQNFKEFFTESVCVSTINFVFLSYPSFSAAFLPVLLTVLSCCLSLPSRYFHCKYIMLFTFSQFHFFPVFPTCLCVLSLLLSRHHFLPLFVFVFAVFIFVYLSVLFFYPLSSLLQYSCSHNSHYKTTSPTLSYKMTYFQDIKNHNQEVAHFMYWFSNQNVIRHHKLDKLHLPTTPRVTIALSFVSTIWSLATTPLDESNYFPCVKSV